MSGDVTVCIPSIPPRHKQLARAVGSALRQTRPPEAFSIAVDNDHQGAAATRTRAVSAASTEWCALLDDDDWLHPHHLDVLLKAAEEDPSVGYWFTYFEVHGGTDPLNTFGKVFDPADPHQTTTTILIRTEIAQEIGWHMPKPGQMVGRQMAGEDFQLTLDCIAAGVKIQHIPKVTWTYVHSAEPGVGNTSGMGNRW